MILRFAWLVIAKNGTQTENTNNPIKLKIAIMLEIP